MTTEDTRELSETMTCPRSSSESFERTGEMGELVRELDWSKTSLGPTSAWAQSLRTSVSICLSSRFPTVIYWGPEFVTIYNDGYIPILGTKHPWALGRPVYEVWSEIWTLIEPMMKGVVSSGVATWSEDQLLIMSRKGYVEETYFTFSFAPVAIESGETGGLYVAVTETTERVLGERRLHTLRELGTALGRSRTEEEVCEAATRVLHENDKDVPFTLLYLLDREGRQARLASASGRDSTSPSSGKTASPDREPLSGSRTGDATSPALLSLDDNGGDCPLARVARTGLEELVAVLPQGFSALSDSARAESIPTALVLPITRAGQDRPYGLLVAGVNPRRRLDENYRTFFKLVADQIATALASARAFQEERQRAETLAEIDRAKTQFFSNVSHEFRTPLTLMLGPLEDLLAREDRAERRADLETAYRNALRLLKLVNSLLGFSRIEAGRARAVYEPTDLAMVTADLASAFRSATERASLELKVDCPPLPAPISVDRDMWEKIVLNLLSNAFKFTFEGSISVSLRQVENRAELRVTDTGIGIPENELPHLFERFHRVVGAKARTYEGSGIGLALVHELVRLHGGTIEVSSQVDHGTTFTISLPAGDAHLPVDRALLPSLSSTSTGPAPFVQEALRWLPEPDTEARAGEAAPRVDASRSRPKGPQDVGHPSEGRKPKLDTGGLAKPTDDAPPSGNGHSIPKVDQDALILIADDNADMRDYLVRLIRTRWRVEAVADGSAALARARERRPDLILSDVMMPVLDGFGLLRQLRNDDALRRVPLILLSARAGEEAKVEGLDAGADDYLVKPFTAKELLARIQTHLTLSRLRSDFADAQSAIKMRDEFLSIASHELRTPLTVLKLYMQNLRKAVAQKNIERHQDRISSQVERAERQTDRLSRLVESLLDVSQIGGGHLRLELEEFDLLRCLEDVLARFAPEAEKVGCEIDRSSSGSGDMKAIKGRWDRSRVEQVVGNLLTNAFKFGPSKPVHIGLELKGEQVLLTVRDHGIGIAQQDLDRIFGCFERAISTRHYGGFGLGLYITRQIVETHGGSVHVESRPGHGSTFVVVLPLVTQDPNVTAMETSPAEMLHS